MVDILLLLAILIVDVFVFWILWHFIGKAGLFIFAAFAVIQANYQASQTLTLAGISVIPSICTYVMLFVGLVFMIERFGKRSAMEYMYIALGIAFLSQLANLFTVLLWIRGIDLWPLFRATAANLVALGLGMWYVIWMYGLLKERKVNKYLNYAITLSVAFLIDAFLFLLIVYVGNMAFGDMMIMMLHNWWQKIIVMLLTLPIFYYFVMKRNENAIKTEQEA